MAKYRERFSDVGIYENQVYDGIPELLGFLRDHGFVLAIASSKRRSLWSGFLNIFIYASILIRCTEAFLTAAEPGKAK